MGLTRRQQEFLQAVWGIYRRTGEPVHYGAVGQALGVSKWTAYDMLRSLERQGWLRAAYQLNGGEHAQGRSMLVYIPQEPARRTGAGQGEAAGETGAGHPAQGRAGQPDRAPAGRGWVGEWSRVRGKLSDLYRELRRSGSRPVVEKLRAEASQAESPLAFCAYLIVILAIQAGHISRQSLRTVQELVRFAPRPEMALSVFAGAVLGGLMLLPSRDSGWVAMLARQISRYQAHLAGFDPEQQRLLLEVLEEALDASATSRA